MRYVVIDMVKILKTWKLLLVLNKILAAAIDVQPALKSIGFIAQDKMYALELQTTNEMLGNEYKNSYQSRQ